MIYGYARISTPKQSIERQIQNIKSQDASAAIYKETYTGTTTDRPEWQRLLRKVKSGDTIIFDEVSRMSRNAAEGFETYTELYQKGVELVFIKEPHINTSVYRKAVETKLEGVGNEIADTLIEAVNKVMQIVQRQQIEAAFDTAEKEVEYLHKRTSEGVRRAMAEGKQVGRQEGSTVETKKAAAAKALIRKHSKDFGGSLSDAECMRLIGVARNTFYKYKREIKEGH